MSKAPTHQTQAQETDEQQKIAVDAAMRALSGEHHLHGQFGGDNLQGLAPASYYVRSSQSDDDETIAKLPELNDKTGLRGCADSIALYLKHHDADAHKKHAPQAPNARVIYDMLEQLRCETRGSTHYRGIRQNILSAMDETSRLRGYGDPARSIPIPREESLFATLRATFFDIDLDETTPAALSTSLSSHEWIAKKLDAEMLEQLKSNMGNPELFAALASKFADHIINDKTSDDEKESDSSDDEENISETEQSSDQDDCEDSQEQDAAAAEQQSSEKQAEQEEQLGQEEMDQDTSMSEDDNAGNADPLDQERVEQDLTEDPSPRYKIFTESHDQTVLATEMASVEELHHLREKLDQQLEPLKAVVSKLANRLQRRLMAQQQRSWQFDVDDGMLDPARLARIITTPGSPLSYKREKDTDFKDTLVTLLIDNSGSMRGRPITIAALSTDILARTLERCGIKIEILGFTTSAWKGGFSREDWGKAGRPSSPGRLNDLLHIIYKQADAPWIRSRKNLGLMLKDGLLKENIDGEALRWAYGRLRRRPEHRKIMMVISDGAPVDDSTLSANYAQFLEHDLIRTITDIERQKAVELLAIGIGHDVTPYYKRAVTIKQAEELGSTMVDELVKLFST
jgi:cobaltochelatase CobT